MSAPVYEVELKFAVPDPERVIALLQRMGAVPGPALVQVDQYFNHPARDFSRTDEALRIRTSGPRNYVTYKGPVVDSQTKTRREIETRFEDGPVSAAQMGETLVLLGFRKVRDVRKSRVPWGIERSDWHFEIAIDSVEGLGSYVEIETQADEGSREQAREAILALAAELALSQPERRSYLRLLMETGTAT